MECPICGSKPPVYIVTYDCEPFMKKASCGRCRSRFLDNMIIEWDESRIEELLAEYAVF